MVLEVAAGLTTSPVVRFAALVHDLGKAATPREEWPAHRRHDQRGVPIVDAMVRRLAGPNRYRDLGMLAARWHLVVHRAGMLRASTFVRLFDGIAAFKHPERLEGLLVVCESDYRGRGGRVDHQYTQAEQVRAAYAAARSVTARQIMTEGIAPGRRVGELVYQRRAEAVRQALGRAG